MKLPAYPHTKPSGVEWLGDVPEHWEVVTVRRRAKRIQTGGTPPTTEERFYEDGTIPWFGPSSFDDQIALSKPVKLLHSSAVKEATARMFDAGATMIVTIGATLGKVSSLTEAGSCNQQITVIEFDQRHIHPRFASYQIKRLESALRAIAPSATLPILDQGELADIPLGIPQFSEQTVIAAFLDREVGRVDRLVGRKRELIERLKEKRSALISRTVTRGLPIEAAAKAGFAVNPPLKGSCVPWIGAIPKHWESGNLRRFATMRTGHTPSRSEPEYWVDCTIPWFTLSDVWQLRDDKRKYLGETKEMISDLGLAHSAAELLPKGTVIFSRTASIGFSGIMPVPMATTQDFWNWICGPKLRPEYLLLLFRAMRQEFERLVSGSTHKTIYQPDAASLRICVPPLPEQAAIEAYLDAETAKLDALVGKVEEAVERLQEYRTALITAAVTGKIDVRKAPIR